MAGAASSAYLRGDHHNLWTGRAPMTLGGSFALILDRDLGRLAEQLEAYPDEESLWIVAGTTKNSAGTLALHMVGNLEHFVGSVMGGTGYRRDREAEFGDRDVPRAELLRRVEACRATINQTLATMEDDVLMRPYPGPSPRGLGDEAAHTFLLHLTAHFSWHLGQMDYHRRMI
jgi:uncharacterized damage-inducible protein DinB